MTSLIYRMTPPNYLNKKLVPSFSSIPTASQWLQLLTHFWTEFQPVSSFLSLPWVSAVLFLAWTIWIVAHIKFSKPQFWASLIWPNTDTWCQFSQGVPVSSPATSRPSCSHHKELSPPLHTCALPSGWFCLPRMASRPGRKDHLLVETPSGL